MFPVPFCDMPSVGVTNVAEEHFGDIDRFLDFARNDRGGARNDRGGVRNDRGGARNDRGGARNDRRGGIEGRMADTQ